ncbi:hypothetical protein [Paenibacillus xylanexedens]|uniref:hypothetical protein n=1 Tax=Paenibacillus xylanexedens TaxID=528191 RepID=UPI00119EB2D9|nr:hypothetical protein [Paenibacillus xylanexedens]
MGAKQVVCQTSPPGTGLKKGWFYQVVMATADMIIVRDYNRQEGMFPSEYFRKPSPTDTTATLDDMMIEMESARQLLLEAGLPEAADRLGEMASEINDMQISISEEAETDEQH